MRTSSVDQVIIDVLSREHIHLTSLQVFEEIRGRLPAVNQSTVYRALERLVRNGRVSVSDMGTGSSVYEIVDGGRHHHLVCEKCGQVVTIGDDDVHCLFEKVEEKYRFEISTNHLVLFGICRQCQEQGGQS